MKGVEYSNHWFDRIPSALFEWGDFFAALRYELTILSGSPNIRTARLYLPGHQSSYCRCWEDERDISRLTFSFYEDSIHVYWATETIGADHFSVNGDLTWSYDSDDMGKMDGLTPEIESWLEYEETVAGKVAVLAIAIAKTWMDSPPGKNFGMSLAVRGPWID